MSVDIVDILYKDGVVRILENGALITSGQSRQHFALANNVMKAGKVVFDEKHKVVVEFSK